MSTTDSIAEPPAIQSFTDVAKYKAAKKMMFAYAIANDRSNPVVRYYRLIEEYKHETHFWILNGNDAVSKDHQYVLNAVGEVSSITIKLARTPIRNLVIEGAIFSKPSVLYIGCPVLELQNCSWTTPEASLRYRSVDKLIITNPIGGRAVVTSTDQCRESSSNTGRMNDLLKTLLLSRLAADLQ